MHGIFVRHGTFVQNGTFVRHCGVIGVSAAAVAAMLNISDDGDIILVLALKVANSPKLAWLRFQAWLPTQRRRTHAKCIKVAQPTKVVVIGVLG